MKKFILLLAIASCWEISPAQRTEVRYTEANIGNSMKNSSYIEIRDADIKLVEKRWLSFLKDKGARAKETDGEFLSENVVVSLFGSDTIDIYSMVEAIGKDVRVTVAVDRNGEFVNNRAGSFDAVDRLLTEFDVAVRKEIVKGEIEVAEKLLNTHKRTVKDLERENERLEKSIKDYKSKISDAERDIIKNKGTIESTKNLENSQEKVVNDLKKKRDGID